MCIESCALLESGGYNTALEILRKQFGQPHMILNRLMSELLDRKRISAGDGDGLWALVSSMKKCQVTLSQMGYVNDLNSTSNLLKIQMLLPIGMQNAWADKAHDLLQKGEPTFLDMLDFLEKKAEVSCNMFGRSIGKSSNVSIGSSTNERPKVKANNIKTRRKLQCFYCNEEHMLTSCIKFLHMNYDERLKVVKEKRLCYRCLVISHSVHRCRRDQLKCSKCDSMKHHELLHPTEQPPVVTSRAAMSGRNVYLMVVPVQVRASNGNQVTTLALLDNGSDSSLCSDSLRRKLGVSGQRVTYTSVTINGEETKDGLTIELNVKGMREEKEIATKVLTVDNIPSSSDAAPTKDELQKWDHLSDLPVSDNKNLKVDLLIGADNPEAFWVIDERRNQPKDPYAIKTPLGWCVMGPGLETKTRSICHRISITNEQLLEQLKKTWIVDNGFEVDEDSIEDKRAKQIMSSTASQTNTNNYQMGLLWKSDNHKLPCNKPLAKIRLSCLERKLHKDPELQKKYAETVESYISKGYAEPVEGAGDDGNEWYLPHHPVIHPRKPGKARENCI
ncbi:uncharacterized protein LOC117109467 [Anneissia japonica]|uniref:uncharacterized protein LOC117109467 n=1 Tax=Anneissia japonica TaxID=1529436 RepID=UPI0014258454|nr:uncharacterized protein LOC117109467 [Anneissia japonica]